MVQRKNIIDILRVDAILQQFRTVFILDHVNAMSNFYPILISQLVCCFAARIFSLKINTQLNTR